MAIPSNEELLAQIQALGMEVHSLRDEVERLKRGDAAEREALQAGAPASWNEPVRATPPVAPAPEPLPKKAPALAPKFPRAPAKPAWKFDEKFVGEKLLQYAGIVILTLGIVFFLIWTAAHAGPEVRVLLAAGAGAALIAAGLKAAKHPPYGQMTGALVGGGWTILYVTAYAAGHWDATKILSDPATSVGALLATAAGMIGHAVARRSRPLRIYAVSLTYFVMMFCGQDVPSFDLFLILFAASAVVAVGAAEADVLIASLLGYYLNYSSVYIRVIGTAPRDRTFANFLSPALWLTIPYLIVAALPLVPKARRLFGEAQAKIADAALCLNSVLFALVAGSMGRVYFGVPSLKRAAVMALLFAVPSLLYRRVLSRRTAAAGLDAVIALGLLAAAVFAMPDPMWKLLAWISVSCAWVWIGMVFEEPVWRGAGLAMSLLTFGFYWNVASLGAESRRGASMALFVFTAASYMFSRFQRLWLETPEPWEEPASTLWLHAGSFALVLGLWGVLDAAPFLCALCALAVAAEFAAQKLRRADFWKQAVVVEFGLGVYSFFVDYGANAPVAGITPRLWTIAVVLATYAYLYFEDVVDDELAANWKGRPKAELRAALTWMASFVAAFAIYKEFDGRARLPVWALWSLALYWAGRVRRETHFKHQSVVLAAAAAVEAGVTYLMYPSALLSPLDSYKAVFFWGAVAALIGGLFLSKDKRWGEPSPLDVDAAQVFGLLPLVLGACYFGKELDSVKLTLAWTGLGMAFLVGGLALDWRELRRPALGLLALCVAKALFSDTANMPLPYRVASFVALGGVLLVGSSLYVRFGSNDEKVPPSRLD
jgi:hypothetical protein